MELTMRQKAARKAARTRKANAAGMRRWLEIDKPSHEATVALVNEHIKRIGGVRVSFNPRESGLTLRKKSKGLGTLCRVIGTGLTWRVLVDGYAQARDYYAGFWDLVQDTQEKKS